MELLLLITLPPILVFFIFRRLRRKRDVQVALMRDIAQKNGWDFQQDVDPSPYRAFSQHIGLSPDAFSLPYRITGQAHNKTFELFLISGSLGSMRFNSMYGAMLYATVVRSTATLQLPLGSLGAPVLQGAFEGMNYVLFKANAAHETEIDTLLSSLA